MRTIRFFWVLLAFAALFFGCGPDTRSLKQALAEVTAQWADADDRLSTWTRRLENNRRDFSDSLAFRTPSPSELASWKPRTLALWDSIAREAAGLEQQFEKLSLAVDGLQTQWKYQALNLARLRSEVGKPDLDVALAAVQVADFEKEIDFANQALADWSPIIRELEDRWPVLIRERSALIFSQQAPTPTLPISP